MLERLKQRVVEDGVIANNQVLMLDTLLTHQVDAQFALDAGTLLAEKFQDAGVTKIVTIESSGISIAMAAALKLGVPFVFVRRKATLTTDSDVWTERVPSYTKGIVSDLILSKSLISADDRVLLIDDIIANGDGAKGLVRMMKQTGATLVGFGIAIEKVFQDGGASLRKAGLRVESLVKVESLDGGKITLA